MSGQNPSRPKQMELSIETMIAFMSLHGITHLNTHKEYPEKKLKAFITVEHWDPEEDVHQEEEEGIEGN